MTPHNIESNGKGFPVFQRRANYNITTTKTDQNAKIGVFRCSMTIPVNKMAQYEDTDKWIFDCNVNGIRRVYWEYVGVLRAAFDRSDVKIGDKYQLLIDDTDGKLYTLLYDKPLLNTLQLVENGEEYRSYMKRLLK